MNDNQRITRLLVLNGCNIEQEDTTGQSPLFICVNYRSYKSLKILIENGCDINKQE
jgi:ankyrin repeat protein